MARTLLVFLSLAMCASGMEGLASLHQPLTLVVDAEKPMPPEALASMKAELDRLFSRSEVRIDLKDRREMALGVDVADLVLVRFKGECRIKHEPVLLDERGPGALAYTHITEGEILSFSEVLCDRVRRATKSAMWGGEHGKGDQLLGRALARVVAHEVFHILSKEKKHGKGGVFQRGLTGRQLIDEELDFHDEDHDKIRRRSPGP